MSPRQTRFVHEYLIDRNGAAAAVRAGYSQRTARQIAYELLTRPHIAAAVCEGEARIAADAQVTREKVLAELQEAIDMARLKGDPMAMIAGWREVAKLCGFYAPERKKVEISVEGEALQRKISGATDAELLAIIDGRQLDS